jgi:hypothetical protein
VRFPLLVDASPSTVSNGPNVLVRSGKWKVESDHKDSTVHVMIGEQPYDNGSIIEIEDHAKARVCITSIGREKTINVFLVRV